jgi:hypothetical protein
VPGAEGFGGVPRKRGSPPILDPSLESNQRKCPVSWTSVCIPTSTSPASDGSQIPCARTEISVRGRSCSAMSTRSEPHRGLERRGGVRRPEAARSQRRSRFADGPAVGRPLRGSDRWGSGRHRHRPHAIETFLLGIAGLLQTIEPGGSEAQALAVRQAKSIAASHLMAARRSSRPPCAGAVWLGNE